MSHISNEVILFFFFLFKCHPALPARPAGGDAESRFFILFFFFVRPKKKQKKTLFTRNFCGPFERILLGHKTVSKTQRRTAFSWNSELLFDHSGAKRGKSQINTYKYHCDLFNGLFYNHYKSS